MVSVSLRQVLGYDLAGLVTTQLYSVSLIGWFKMHESQKFYPATSFLEEFYLVMQENAKKVFEFDCQFRNKILH